MICALASGLLACSSSDNEAEPSEQAFSGPWAEQYAAMSRDFPSDFASEVFADSSISESEYAEARRIVEGCFAAAGIAPEWGNYGRLSVTAEADSTEPPEAMGECSFADGGVMVLHDQITLNPSHQDDMEIRAECLASHRVVDPAFDAQDLRDAYERETFPWDPADEAAADCLVDPLGLAD